MKIQQFLLIFLLFHITATGSKGNKGSNSPIKDSSDSFTYISDSNFTETIKSQLINRKQIHIMGILFTNGNCQTCKQFQPELILVMKQFHKQKIPFFRCQLAENRQLAYKFRIKRFPVVHFLYRRFLDKKRRDIDIQIYRTSQILSPKIIQLGKYLKKMLQYQQKAIFSQNSLQTLQDIPRTNRIVVNLDKLQMSYNISLQELFSDVILNDLFNSMPVILLPDYQYQTYMVKYDLQFTTFGGKLGQTVIYIALEEQKLRFSHIPIQPEYLDKLSSDGFDVVLLFKSLLFFTVQQFTQDIYNAHQQVAARLNSPNQIYLSILDSIWKRSQSHKSVRLLNRIMLGFQNQICIFWAQGSINPQKKVLLGFQKQSKAPLFGKLILNKDQQKQPLIDLITNRAVFGQTQIKTRIRTDLGYDKILGQKIRNSVKDQALTHSITVQTHINSTMQDKRQIVVILCTSRNINRNQIYTLAYLIKRFKRFYLLSSLKILTNPCILYDQQLDQGLFLTFQNEHFLISKEIQECVEIQPQIQNVTRKISKQLKRISIIPRNFCVQQNEMREFLIQSRERQFLIQSRE